MFNRIKAVLGAFLLTAAVSAGAVAVSSPAMANSACTPGNLCLYPCYLSESCDPWLNGPLGTTCYNTGAGGLNHLTYSVKNNNSHAYHVWHSAGCTGTMSTLYANTSGNMSGIWIAAGIQSIKKI